MAAAGMKVMCRALYCVQFFSECVGWPEMFAPTGRDKKLKWVQPGREVRDIVYK